MVMFEQDRSRLPRTAIAGTEDLGRAIASAAAWCCAQGERIDALRIQVPLIGLIDDLPALGRLEAHGASIFGWKHSSARRRPAAGPTIVVAPDLEHLLEWEDKGTTMLALVGATAEHAPWLAAYTPVIPEGAAVTYPELEVDPVIKRAMTTFTHSINSSTGLTDPRDRSKVTDGLQKLHRAGHTLYPDALAAQALRCNWRGSAALALRTLAAEIAAGRRKHVRETYAPDVVSLWEAEASNRATR